MYTWLAGCGHMCAAAHMMVYEKQSRLNLRLPAHPIDRPAIEQLLSLIVLLPPPVCQEA